jgi:hypothetical protein
MDVTDFVYSVLLLLFLYSSGITLLPQSQKLVNVTNNSFSQQVSF